jgi:hypothetical protein
VTEAMAREMRSGAKRRGRGEDSVFLMPRPDPGSPFPSRCILGAPAQRGVVTWCTSLGPDCPDWR